MIVAVVIAIVTILMASSDAFIRIVRNKSDGSVSIEDAEEVEDIFLDRMFSDLTDACSREFYHLQDHYKFFDIRRLEPSTVAYMNYILKSTGAVIPIDEVVCLDCNRYIWEELCDSQKNFLCSCTKQPFYNYSYYYRT